MNSVDSVTGVSISYQDSFEILSQRTPIISLLGLYQCFEFTDGCHLLCSRMFAAVKIEAILSSPVGTTQGLRGSGNTKQLRTCSMLSVMISLKPTLKTTCL